MKPQRATALHIWMLEHGYTDIMLADEITSLLPHGKSVSARQVARWRQGGAIPRKDPLKVLFTMTAGKVDANSFVGAGT